MAYAQRIGDGAAYRSSQSSGPIRKLRGAPSSRGPVEAVGTSRAQPNGPLGSRMGGGVDFDPAVTPVVPTVRTRADAGPARAAMQHFAAGGHMAAGDDMWTQRLAFPKHHGADHHRSLTPEAAKRMNYQLARTVTNPLTGAKEHHYRKLPPPQTGEHHRLTTEDLKRTNRVLVGKMGYDPNAPKIKKREWRRDFKELQGSDSTHVQAATASRMRSEFADRVNRDVRLNRNGEHPLGRQVRSEAHGPTGFVGNRDGGYNQMRFTPYNLPQFRGLGDRNDPGPASASVDQPAFRGQRLDHQKKPHITAKSDGGPGGAAIGQLVRGTSDLPPTMRSYTEDVLAITGPGGANVGQVVRGHVEPKLIQSAADVGVDVSSYGLVQGPSGQLVRGDADHRLPQHRDMVPPHLRVTHGVPTGPEGQLVRGDALHHLQKPSTQIPHGMPLVHAVETGPAGQLARGDADHRLPQNRADLPYGSFATHNLVDGPAGQLVRGDAQHRIEQTRAQYDAVDVPSYFRPMDPGEKSGPASDWWTLEHDRRVADNYHRPAGTMAMTHNEQLIDGSTALVDRQVTAMGHPNEGQRTDGLLGHAHGPALQALDGAVVAQGLKGRATEAGPGPRSFKHGGVQNGTAPGASYLARQYPQTYADSGIRRDMSTDAALFNRANRNARLRSQTF